MASIPPVNAHTEIDIEDSCNCCWGFRKKKERKLTPAEEAFAEKITYPDADKPRDITEVYDLTHVKVEKHTRTPTTYPRPHNPDYDAGSSQSSSKEKK